MPRTDCEILEDLLSIDDVATFMKAYFDESGKHEQAEVLTMAGIVASSASWKSLQTRWMKALHRLKLKTPFHASDCAVPKKNPKKRSPFDGMPLDRREEIQSALIDTMKGLDVQGMAMSVIRSEYERLKPDIRANKRLHNPWFLAFEGAIGEMMSRSAERGKLHTISFTFDRQDEFGDLAKKLYNEILAYRPAPSYYERLGSLTFSPKDKLAPLQAIDLIVYEVNLHVRECRIKGAPERWQSKKLRKTIDVGGHIGDYVLDADVTFGPQYVV